jgi:hypothetical protein
MLPSGRMSFNHSMSGWIDSTLADVVPSLPGFRVPRPLLALLCGASSAAEAIKFQVFPSGALAGIASAARVLAAMHENAIA